MLFDFVSRGDALLEQEVNQIAKRIKASSSSNDDHLSRSEFMDAKALTTRLAQMQILELLLSQLWRKISSQIAFDQQRNIAIFIQLSLTVGDLIDYIVADCLDFHYISTTELIIQEASVFGIEEADGGIETGGFVVGCERVVPSKLLEGGVAVKHESARLLLETQLVNRRVPRDQQRTLEHHLGCVNFETRVDCGDADLGDGGVEQAEGLEAVGVGRNSREPVGGVHAVEEPVEVHALDRLHDPEAAGMTVEEGLEVVDVVGEDPDDWVLLHHRGQAVDAGNGLTVLGGDGLLEPVEEYLAERPGQQHHGLGCNESPEDTGLLLIEVEDEEDLHLAQDQQSVAEVLVPDVDEEDEVGVAPPNQLQRLGGDSHQSLQKDEDDDDQADDEVPLLVLFVLLRGNALADEDGERSAEGREGDEEAYQCVDVDVEGLELVNREENREINDNGPKVRHQCTMSFLVGRKKFVCDFQCRILAILKQSIHANRKEIIMIAKEIGFISINLQNIQNKSNRFNYSHVLQVIST